jgi:hypothetical protein
MLFADIKGSMDLIEELDPEEARAIVDPAQADDKDRAALRRLRCETRRRRGWMHSALWTQAR